MTKYIFKHLKYFTHVASLMCFCDAVYSAWFILWILLKNRAKDTFSLCYKCVTFVNLYKMTFILFILIIFRNATRKLVSQAEFCIISAKKRNETVKTDIYHHVFAVSDKNYLSYIR